MNPDLISAKRLAVTVTLTPKNAMMAILLTGMAAPLTARSKKVSISTATLVLMKKFRSWLRNAMAWTTETLNAIAENTIALIPTDALVALSVSKMKAGTASLMSTPQTVLFATMSAEMAT